MYAMLMKKVILSNEVILFNPVTIIEGSFNEEYDCFIDKFNNEFFSIDDFSFAISELTEGIYYNMLGTGG